MPTFPVTNIDIVSISAKAMSANLYSRMCKITHRDIYPKMTLVLIPI